MSSLRGVCRRVRRAALGPFRWPGGVVPAARASLSSTHEKAPRPGNKSNGSPHPSKIRKKHRRNLCRPVAAVAGALLLLSRVVLSSPVPMFAAGSGPSERRCPCPPPPRFWYCPQLCVAEAHEKDRQWRASQPAWGDFF